MYDTLGATEKTGKVLRTTREVGGEHGMRE